MWFCVVDLVDMAPCGSLAQAVAVAEKWARESACVVIVSLGGEAPAAVVAEWRNGRRWERVAR